MGKIIFKIIVTLFWSSVAMLSIYLFCLIVASLYQGYTWDEMDWSQSGKTSIKDFFYASEVGRREVIVDGKKCIEYYSYKDGLPVKNIC